MFYRTAKIALLLACLAFGLSAAATQAQQRDNEAKRPPKPTAPPSRPSDKKDGNQKETDKPGRDAKRNENKEPVKREPARKGPAKKEPPKKEAVKSTKDRMSVTPEREAAVRTFVERNHPELAQLLAHLKENQPKEYERAIRELFRTTERLTLIHDRDRTQYDREVAVWKTQSRIQLLTARLKMEDSDELRAQLKQLLSEQIDNRIALLKHEREKVATRLNRIDSDLERLEKDREKAIERQLRALTERPNPQRTKSAE